MLLRVLLRDVHVGVVFKFEAIIEAGMELRSGLKILEGTSVDLLFWSGDAAMSENERDEPQLEYTKQKASIRFALDACCGVLLQGSSKCTSAKDFKWLACICLSSHSIHLCSRLGMNESLF
jgi:hypothetical protein